MKKETKSNRRRMCWGIFTFVTIVWTAVITLGTFFSMDAGLGITALTTSMTALTLVLGFYFKLKTDEIK